MNAGSIESWECEECLEKFNLKEENYFMCPECNNLYCDNCIGEHLKECITFSECTDKKKFPEMWECEECGEIYETYEEAEECCSEEEE